MMQSFVVDFLSRIQTDKLEIKQNLSCLVGDIRYLKKTICLLYAILKALPVLNKSKQCISNGIAKAVVCCFLKKKKLSGVSSQKICRIIQSLNRICSSSECFSVAKIQHGTSIIYLPPGSGKMELVSRVVKYCVTILSSG